MEVMIDDKTDEVKEKHLFIDFFVGIRSGQNEKQ